MDRGFAPDITRREGELARPRVSGPLIKERPAGVGDYTNFYLGSVTVAGALAGLLFVALSVAPQRLSGSRPAEHQAIAGTAYTALIDALWISLFALRPGNVLPAANLTFAVIGLVGTGRLARRLWRARTQESVGRRWLYLMIFIMLVYLAQGIIGATVRRPDEAQAFGASLVTIFFAIGIARSWEMLGPGRGGLISEFADHADSIRRRDTSTGGPADGSPPQQ